MDFGIEELKSGIKPIKIERPKIRISAMVKLPRKIDYARMTNFLNKRIREPIPAKRKKEALEKAKHKCQWPRCKEKNTLDIHHENMNPENNRLSNLIVLCPTHHRKHHQKHKRVDTYNIIGRRVSSRVYTKEKARKIKKARKENRLEF